MFRYMVYDATKLQTSLCTQSTVARRAFPPPPPLRNVCRFFRLSLTHPGNEVEFLVLRKQQSSLATDVWLDPSAEREKEVTEEANLHTLYTRPSCLGWLAHQTHMAVDKRRKREVT